MRSAIFSFFLLAVCLPVIAQQSQTHAGCAYEIIRPAGVADGFQLPADVRHPSPALAAYLQNRFPKDYDDMAADHHFGDSFKLDACTICDQLCSAVLEIELKGTGGLDCNDSIFIGRAGGTAVAFGPIYLSGCPVGPEDPNTEFAVWKQALAGTFSRTITLDTKALQDLVCLEGYEWLDVIVQDDHGVDSMRLTIQH